MLLLGVVLRREMLELTGNFYSLLIIQQPIIMFSLFYRRKQHARRPKVATRGIQEAFG